MDLIYITSCFSIHQEMIIWFSARELSIATPRYPHYQRLERCKKWRRHLSYKEIISNIGNKVENLRLFSYWVYLLWTALLMTTKCAIYEFDNAFIKICFISGSNAPFVQISVNFDHKPSFSCVVGRNEVSKCNVTL